MKARLVLASALACLMSLPAFAAGADSVRPADIAASKLTPKDFPRWREVAAGVYLYEGLHAPDRKGVTFNTVSLIVITGEGVVVVDGQGDVAQTQLMIDHIKKLTPQPIKYVVIASDHGDHTGGNAAFKAAFPDVVFMSSPASQKTLAKNANPPTQTVADKHSIRLGKTEVQVLNLGRAHTGGDLVAYLPDSKILFMSEVYLRGLFPAMRSAYPSEWLATIAKAQAMDVSLYVPGHGFIDDAATMKRDLEESRKAIAYVIDEAKRLHAAGVACGTAAECPAAEQANWGPYGDWTARDSQAPLALAKVYQEIEGKLP